MTSPTLTGTETQLEGPTTAVLEGDTISFDILNRKLTLDVAEEEIDARMAKFKTSVPSYRLGVFAKYANSVSSASQGALTS